MFAVLSHKGNNSNLHYNLLKLLVLEKYSFEGEQKAEDVKAAMLQLQRINRGSITAGGYL